MADRAHAETDKIIEKMQRHIARIYSSAERDVSKELKKYAKTIKNRSDEILQDILEAETERAKNAAKNAYKRFYLIEVKRDPAFKKVTEKAAHRLYLANNEMAAYINTKTANIYTMNYNQIGNGLQSDLSNYDFQDVSEQEAESYGDIEQQTVDKKKDTDWNAKNITKAVIAGALLLYGADKIFSNAAKNTTDKNRSAANRQASDMATGAENKGRLDSMYRASDEGFNVKKYWIATLDNRTRETHREYDSMAPVDLDYEYAPGLKKPKDPDCSDLSEVCNCRCKLAYDTGHGKSATRAARWYKEGAGREGVENLVKGSYKKQESFSGTKTERIKNMTYREWMEWRSR